VNRRWVSRYFDAVSAMGLDIDAARGGGEDIVFSYAMRAATGQRPLVVPGHYEDLIARHALANRNGSQVADRTRIMQACQRWLESRSALTTPVDLPPIDQILPHRYPFLLVDRIDALSSPDSESSASSSSRTTSRSSRPATLRSCRRR
jgi:hypothetical protein